MTHAEAAQRRTSASLREHRALCELPVGCRRERHASHLLALIIATGALMLMGTPSFTWGLGSNTPAAIPMAPSRQVAPLQTNAVPDKIAKTNAVSQDHADPMLTLGLNHLPMTEIIKAQEKENFYACQGVVAHWFLDILSQEMNYFAGLSKLVTIDPSVCVISIENEKSLTPGLMTIRLYQTFDQLNNCIQRHKCKIEHNVTLVIKRNGVYRSYFLTDLQHERYVEHCVSDQGQWFKNTNCYQID
jgi:hypothetical protein